VNVVFVDDSVHAGDVHVVQAGRDHHGRVALEHGNISVRSFITGSSVDDPDLYGLWFPGSGSFYHKAKIVK
jgi:hypothetical protein